ncbi:MAG: phage tail protein [Candidatus Sumerlaeia bacterium]|nr:phage tail protein [Candidatus Sumerlaeia bacterium]
MKTFSPEMNLLRKGRSHDLAWLVELDWSAETGRYSTRPVTVGSHAYRPIVIGIEGPAMVLPSILPDSPPVRPAVRVELASTAEQGAGRFDLRVESDGIEGRTVRIGFLFPNPNLVLQPTDIVWIQTYRVESCVLESGKAVLHLLEALEADGRRMIGRRLFRSMDPALSPAAIGRVIPLLFGRIARSPLVPWRVGRRGHLRGALAPDARIIAVEDATIFPAEGAVQIGDEVIFYSALDRTRHTLGRDDSPVLRPTPAFHRDGAAVDSIPEGGFQYFVADHLCLSVGPVYSGNRALDPAEYTVAADRIAGRDVQKVVFPILPAEARYSPARAVRRIDGRHDPNLWSAGAGNTAASPLAALDGSGSPIAAVLTASAPRLEVEYLGDLSGGTLRHGRFERCRLVIEYSASVPLLASSAVAVIAGRGNATAAFALPRPPASENIAALPAHTHVDSIRDQIADTRPLFEIGLQTAVVDFDEALPPAAGWNDRDRAIDGNLGTWTQNKAVGDPPITSPLAFRLLRRPLGSSSDIVLESVEFCVRLSSDESTPVSASLDVALAGKYANSRAVQAAATPAHFSAAVSANSLTTDDLVHPATQFAVRSLDGRQIKLYGAWLTLHYRPRIAGRDRSISQWRSGTIEASTPAPLALPTKTYRQTFDLTALAEANGGWAFFATKETSRPFVRVEFSGIGDPTHIRISGLAFEIEYSPREGAEVADRFDARVEGIAPAGTLLENPADLIEWLATSPDGLGWPADAIDAESFAQARQWLDARDWRLSRRLAVQIPVGQLLGEIAAESACRLVCEAGKLRLLPSRPLVLASDAAASIDSTTLFSAPLVKRRQPLRNIANAIRLRYGSPYSLTGAELRKGAVWIELEAPDSSAAHESARVRDLHAHWLASAPPAQALRLAAAWLDHVARPRQTVEVVLPISHAHLECGDTVVLTYAPSRLNGALGEVVAIEFADLQRVRLTLALQTLAMYCWYADAATYIVHSAGAGEKVFVIAGRRVASLDRTGCLRLAGEVIEHGLSESEMLAAIEYDPVEQRICFGVGAPQAGYRSVMALDCDGRLILRGSVRELADLSGLATGACHTADEAFFLFSCNLTTVVAAYNAADGRLDLAGSLVEHAPL